MQKLQKIFFRLRHSFGIKSRFRRVWWQMQGAQFGRGTNVPPLSMNWPHQVRFGDNCKIEPNSVFNFDGIWKPGPAIQIGDQTFIGRDCEFNIRQGIRVGPLCLIASGCKFIDHDHDQDTLLNERKNRRPGIEAPITLEEGVWLGVNVVVLKGITIERGAIVAAGAVVTKSIGANEIWAGVPARKIGQRSSS